MEADDILVPEWLLWEILIRLPSKSVLRCKVVSKQWACLISDPLFVGSYVSRHSSSSRSWTVVVEDVVMNELSFVLVNERKNFGRLGGLPNIGEWKVLGASNGLILVGMIDHFDGLCRYISRNIYYLCNPSTGESIPLPLLPELLVIDGKHYWGPIGLLTRITAPVLLLESYRVVLSLPYTGTGNCLRFGVYASESQEWKEFVLPSEHGDIKRVVPATLNNQILHWLTTDGSVIAYDPYASPDRITIIAPPPTDDDNLGFIAPMCDASGGKLRYFENFLSSLRFKLWVLEPSGWSLSHQSSIPDHRMLDPMFFNPSDADILYLVDEFGLVSCHVKTGKLEVVRDYMDDERSSCYPLYPRGNAFLVQVSPWPVSLTPSVSSTY